jgi:hypothetical protein
MTTMRAVATTLLVPVVETPPVDAKLGDIVYREDREEFAVKTVLGWMACRPARASLGR